jgi:monofunctional biosynthetic peptidoglycan transglycosylase
MPPRTRANLKTRLLHWLLAPWRWLKRLVCLIGWFVVGWLLLIGVAIGWLLYDLPATDSLQMALLEKRVQARVDERISNPQARYAYTPLHAINRDLLYAIVLAEDAHFFEHSGLNYDALIDALIANYRRGENAFGGSTITQQVAKNLFLDNGKSYRRKIQEVVITRRLEQALSKNEILELYLNVAEFGPDIYGVAAAGDYYFGSSPEAIDAAQGAYLALFLPSPRRYHYTLHQNRNRTPAFVRKYKTILRGMAQLDYISSEQYRHYEKRIEESRWP